MKVDGEALRAKQEETGLFRKTWFKCMTTLTDLGNKVLQMNTDKTTLGAFPCPPVPNLGRTKIIPMMPDLVIYAKCQLGYLNQNLNLT